MRVSALLRAALPNSQRPPVIDIRGATFYRNPPTPPSPQEPLLKKFSFTLPSFPQPPQSWAVVGSSAEARTAFLEALRGNLYCEPPTARTYPYLSSEHILQKDPRLRSLQNAMGYVGFDAERGPATLRGAYLSARYESHREQSDFKLADYLVGKTEINAAEELYHRPPESLFNDLVYMLALRDLLDMPVSNLSNGQTRRARIARALLFQPEVLLLNSPFMGIDQFSQEMIDMALHQYSVTYSPRLIFGLGSMEYTPFGITHMALLGPGPRLFVSGEKDAVYFNMRQIRVALSKLKINEVPNGFELAKFSDDCANLVQSQRTGGRLTSRDKNFDKNTRDTEHEGRPSDWTSRDGFPSIDIRVIPAGDALVEMKGVKLSYGDKTVLGGWQGQEHEGDTKGEGLWWTVRRGDRWGVFGTNGSGKTTLTAIVTSDHPQAYSLPVKIFGKSRLPEPGNSSTNVSIFDLQQRIGMSSPEVHAFFPKHLSVRRALESAWADAPLAKVVLTSEVDALVSAVLRWFQGDICPDLGDHLLLAEEAIRPHAAMTGKNVTGLTSGARDRIIKHYEAVADPSLLDWADERTFASLSFTSQRLVLFLRAIIKSPDIVILDEAFSGMDGSLVQKCHAFLAWGENSQINYMQQNMRLTKTKRATRMRPSDLSLCGLVQFPGLKDEQALIVISHTREEVPGSVRQWLRLPDPESGEPARMGVLTGPLEADPWRWKTIWSRQPSKDGRPDRTPKMQKVVMPPLSAAAVEAQSILTSTVDWDGVVAALAEGKDVDAALDAQSFPPTTSPAAVPTSDGVKMPRPYQKSVLSQREWRATRSPEQKERTRKYEREYNRQAASARSPKAKRARLDRAAHLLQWKRTLVLSADHAYEQETFAAESDRPLKRRVQWLLARVAMVDGAARGILAGVYRRLQGEGLAPLYTGQPLPKRSEDVPLETIRRARFTPDRLSSVFRVSSSAAADPRVADMQRAVLLAVRATHNACGHARSVMRAMAARACLTGHDDAVTTTTTMMKPGKRFILGRTPSRVAGAIEDALFAADRASLPLPQVALRLDRRRLRALAEARAVMLPLLARRGWAVERFESLKASVRRMERKRGRKGVRADDGRAAAAADAADAAQDAVEEK